MAPQRVIVVAIAGLLATTTIAVTGATAASRSGRVGTVAIRADRSALKTATPSSAAEIGSGIQIRNTVTVMGVSQEGDIGRAALALLRFDWATLYPGWTIAFLPARSTLLGMTLVRERRVEVYIRTDRSVAATAHDLAHELGHVTDVMYNDDASRARYLTFRALPVSTAWWTCNGCRDLQVPAGDFAETFALVASPRYRFYSDVAAEPTAAALADFVQNVLPPAARTGLTPLVAAAGPAAADA